MKIQWKILKKIIAGFVLLVCLVFVISGGGYLKACIGLVKINYKQQLRDPTYREMKEFLEKDKTSFNDYDSGLFGLFFSYVCVHFARDVKRNAAKQGIRCAGVVVGIENSKSERALHALIVFNTIDRGVIFIEPQTDMEASISPDDQYPWTLLFHCVFWPKIKSKILETKKETKKMKERIGQMLIMGFKGTEISRDSYIVKAVRDVKIGGLILYQRNIVNPSQTEKLISALQHYSPIPLFIVVDAEGGKVNRLKSNQGFSDLPSPKELGKTKDYNLTKQVTLKLSQELKDLGFNLNFAPVVDVDVNPKNPIIGALGRSFSSDAQEVAFHAQAFIEAHHQNNIITVVKHFPGHGSSDKDSHLGQVDITNTYTKEELIPYKLLQEKGLLDAVMTAHIVNRNIDKNHPATFSSSFLQNILREQIGFEGVIISDDIEMGAISKYYSFEDALIRAINAGCDIVLISNNSLSKFDPELFYKARDIIYQAVKDGKIPEKRIIESSNRIYKLKKRFKIIS